VRRGGARDVREVLESDADWTRNFIAAMQLHSRERAPLVVRAIETGRVRRMLDVGGGSGIYSIAFARANPQLRADILDVPEVTPITQTYIDAAGLSDRIEVKNGDLRSDDFGTGYDLVFLSAICHMLSPDENRDLVRRCAAALASDGQLVIQDFVLSADKTAPKIGALFSLNMLVNTAAGSNYSVEEYAAWMRDAGLSEVRQVPLPGPTSLMIGIRS
jgi:predicted O-methyltransferase YrrM